MAVKYSGKKFYNIGLCFSYLGLIWPSSKFLRTILSTAMVIFLHFIFILQIIFIEEMISVREQKVLSVMKWTSFIRKLNKLD